MAFVRHPDEWTKVLESIILAGVARRDKESNRMPAPESGPFDISKRLYNAESPVVTPDGIPVK